MFLALFVKKLWFFKDGKIDGWPEGPAICPQHLYIYIYIYSVLALGAKLTFKKGIYIIYIFLYMKIVIFFHSDLSRWISNNFFNLAWFLWSYYVFGIWLVSHKAHFISKRIIISLQLYQRKGRSIQESTVIPFPDSGHIKSNYTYIL